MSRYTTENSFAADIEPADHPLGDLHHSEVSFSAEDFAIADKLSWYMGDLFIDSETCAPREQWQRVARALRIHGLKIVNESSTK